MQSLMGETTAVAHGGNPQDRTGSPRPRCIAFFRALLNNGMILRVFWNGHVGGMGILGGTGILPVSCLLWNWHLASFMLIFERAGCPLYSYSFKDSATPNFFLFPIP
ncbi:hypothetical protein [Moorena sp. SIO3F7]|nr:hypothetical protein [Moorena sp. SIO3F7]NEO17004.1 hypothetical protein [Moorena sp. SIO3E8]NEQ04221.1 hypothetical protein [Moorena sp. SIO3F7]